MARRRIYELETATDWESAWIVVDNPGWCAARKYRLIDLLRTWCDWCLTGPGNELCITAAPYPAGGPLCLTAPPYPAGGPLCLTAPPYPAGGPLCLTATPSGGPGVDCAGCLGEPTCFLVSSSGFPAVDLCGDLTPWNGDFQVYYDSDDGMGNCLYKSAVQDYCGTMAQWWVYLELGVFWDVRIATTDGGTIWGQWRSEVQADCSLPVTCPVQSAETLDPVTVGPCPSPPSVPLGLEGGGALLVETGDGSITSE